MSMPISPRWRSVHVPLMLLLALLTITVGGCTNQSPTAALISPIAPTATTAVATSAPTSSSTDPSPEEPTSPAQILEDLKILVNGKTTLTVGATMALQLQARYTDGTSEDVSDKVSWSISPRCSVGILNDGKTATVTATEVRTATTTGSYGGQSGSAAVQVTW
jgi:hypothetical protein